MKRNGTLSYGPVWICLAALVLVATVSPLIGSSHIELRRAFAHISPDFEIFFYARLPRVVLALLAGAALSVTGVLFQCMLRDPLAEPYTLGVSRSGASVGAVLGICFGFRAIGLLSLAGAAGVLMIVLGIAVEGRRLSSFTLLLTGVTMNSMSFAVISVSAQPGELFTILRHIAMADGVAWTRWNIRRWAGWRRWCCRCAGW